MENKKRSMCFSRIRQESNVLQIERGIRVWIRVSTYLRHSESTLPYPEYREFWSWEIDIDIR